MAAVPSVEMTGDWHGSTRQSKAKRIAVVVGRDGASTAICHFRALKLYNGYELKVEDDDFALVSFSEFVGL